MLGTAEVARASGYSVQQVRDLERLGVIPPASRARNGYRAFRRLHVRDLRAYRQVALAVGPVEARRVLRDIRSLPRPEAAALVGGLHARLTREREEALAARRALLAIRAEEGGAETLTITELAAALGVRASTLRFWEQEGLLRPERVEVRAVSARRYPVAAVRDARIVAALRASGYRIPEVRRALDTVHGLADGPDPLVALDARLDALAARTLALLRAGGTLAAIIEAAG
jgi:DNA-binding transcriptional MerR regulator